MSEPMKLVVMRLADMRRMHPDQDSSLRCSECDWPVGVYPTGLKVLREHPGAQIICVKCASKMKLTDITSAGTIAEIAQESRESKDVN